MWGLFWKRGHQKSPQIQRTSESHSTYNFMYFSPSFNCFEDGPHIQRYASFFLVQFLCPRCHFNRFSHKLCMSEILHWIRGPEEYTRFIHNPSEMLRSMWGLLHWPIRYKKFKLFKGCAHWESQWHTLNSRTIEYTCMTMDAESEDFKTDQSRKRISNYLIMTHIQSRSHQTRLRNKANTHAWQRTLVLRTSKLTNEDYFFLIKAFADLLKRILLKRLRSISTVYLNPQMNKK